MANTYSTIGADGSQEEQAALAQRAAAEGDRLLTGRGAYYRLTDTSGAELWVQEPSGGETITLTPHFAGATAFRLRLTDRLERHTDSPLDGAFFAWAPPDEDEEPLFGEGLFPVVFDIPDGGAHDALTLPVVIDVQLAAFAHAVEFHPDEAAYLASQDEPAFAVESFIPSGTFVEGDDPPSAMAILSGRVLGTRELTNSWTGATFRWAHVRTLGGEVDLVADPDVVSGTPTVGGVVSGEFWISGRLPATVVADAGSDGTTERRRRWFHRRP